MESRPVGWGVVACAVAALFTGCANWPPGALPVGTPIAQVRDHWLHASAEYRLPDGGTRLEFDQGAQTTMLDFDAAGALHSTKQVLTQEEFDAIVPGLPAAQVRLRIGRPASVMSIPRQDLQVWNYRFWSNECELFQVSVDQSSQQVTQAGVGPNLSCGGPNAKGGK
jgi:hypothetical protein